jgi:hypothetical protein
VTFLDRGCPKRRQDSLNVHSEQCGERAAISYLGIIATCLGGRAVPYYRYVAPESSDGACPQSPRGYGRADGDNAACLARTPATPLPPMRCSPGHSTSAARRRDRVAREELTAVPEQVRTGRRHSRVQRSTSFDLVAWVRRSTTAAGVPERLEDEATTRDAVVLLAGVIRARQYGFGRDQSSTHARSAHPSIASSLSDQAAPRPSQSQDRANSA